MRAPVREAGGDQGARGAGDDLHGRADVFTEHDVRSARTGQVVQAAVEAAGERRYRDAHQVLQVAERTVRGPAAGLQDRRFTGTGEPQHQRAAAGQRYPGVDERADPGRVGDVDVHVGAHEQLPGRGADLLPGAVVGDRGRLVLVEIGRAAWR